MNRMQFTSVLLIAVLLSPVSGLVWGQADTASKESADPYLPSYPPGPYGWHPAYPPQPVPWGAAPGWMPPPAYGPSPAMISTPGYTTRTEPVSQLSVEEVTSERDNLQAALEIKESALASTHELLAQTRDSLQQAEASIRAVEEEKQQQLQEQARLKEMLSEATAIYDTAETKLGTLNTQIETLRSAVNTQQAELENFQKNAAEQQAEIDRLLSQITSRDEKLAALEAELETAKQALETARSEIDASNEKLASLETEKQVCTNELAILNDQLKLESALNETNDQELATVTEKSEDLAGELSACNGQIAKFREELTIARAETATLLSRLEPQEAQTLAATPAEDVSTMPAAQHQPDAVAIGEIASLGITAASDMEDPPQQTEPENHQTIAEQQAAEKVTADEKPELAVQESGADVKQALMAVAPQQTDETLAAIPAKLTMPDFDRDGINDSIDLCLDSKPDAKVDALGCNAGQPIVMNGVAFRYDSHELSKDARSILDNIASILIRHPDLKFEVAGHTDAQGDSAYNQWLSELRAQAVRDYLIDNGLPEENLSAHGYGAEFPIATNDTRDGLRVNRRVELRRLE